MLDAVFYAFPSIYLLSVLFCCPNFLEDAAPRVRGSVRMTARDVIVNLRTFFDLFISLMLPIVCHGAQVVVPSYV